jgi:hypothetical protein
MDFITVRNGEVELNVLIANMKGARTWRNNPCARQ